jgi:hypothetical protein
MGHLPWEVLSVILTICMEQDLESTRNILKSKAIVSAQLLLLNRGIYNFILSSEPFHRLRLWKVLCDIPNRQDPIKIAVGTSDTNWTLLEVEARNELVNVGQYEDFLVLDEVLPLSGKRRDRYIPQGYSLMHQEEVIPFFDFNCFTIDMVLFATINSMSIWLWTRPCTFFRHNMTRKTQDASLEFKPVFFTREQRELMVWTLPSSDATIYNTDLFRRLI